MLAGRISFRRITPAVPIRVAGNTPPRKRRPCPLCEQCEVVPHAELCEHCVDRAELHAAASTQIAKRHCIDVVPSIRHAKGQRRKALDDRLYRTRAGEPLQQFLEAQSRGHDEFAIFVRSPLAASARSISLGSKESFVAMSDSSHS